jgi:hypothetical protein
MAELLNAYIIKTNEVNIEDKNYDLIGFGSGIYYGVKSQLKLSQYGQQI